PFPAVLRWNFRSSGRVCAAVSSPAISAQAEIIRPKSAFLRPKISLVSPGTRSATGRGRLAVPRCSEVMLRKPPSCHYHFNSTHDLFCFVAGFPVVIFLQYLLDVFNVALLIPQADFLFSDIGNIVVRADEGFP